MRAALREAARGLGHTSPNPAVGAVVVRSGRIVARGYHQRAGAPHAEIEALRATTRAQGATLYVTLEPCSTHGRTPPCTEAIVQAGLKRVVVGATDPNPLHAGRGLSLLTEAGVQVTSGILEQECSDLNKGWNKYITNVTPWVIAKAALSLDGRLTRPPGESQWLTSAAARTDAHRLRSQVDAILVGAGTLRTDNPRLTIRGIPGFEQKQPWRVVLTRGENPLPGEAHVFTDEHRERTLVFTRQPLRTVLERLARERQCTSVLIEGGSRVLTEALDQRLIDEACFYVAPLLCGGPVAAFGGRASLHLAAVRYKRLGPDVRMSGFVVRSGAAPSR